MKQPMKAVLRDMATGQQRKWDSVPTAGQLVELMKQEHEGPKRSDLRSEKG